MVKESQRKRFFEIFFLVLVVLVSVIFLRMLAPFFIAIILAALAARIFWGLFSRLQRLFRNTAPPAALATVLILAFAVILPLTLLGVAAYAELSSAFATVSQHYEELGGEDSPLEGLKDLPLVGRFLGELNLENIAESTENYSQEISEFAVSAFRASALGLAGGVAHTFLMLLLVFFFLLDGPSLINGIKEILPISHDDFHRITEEAVRTAGATLRATVVIGIGEGTFGTLMFLVFGLPAAILWGMVMVVASMIPVVGTNFVLVPAAIFVIMSGRLGAGLLMLGLSVAVVTFSQEVIKPILLGDSSGMHPAMVLLATLGGLAWLGVIGFILGPVIAALFVVLWRLFSRSYTDAAQVESDT